VEGIEALALCTSLDPDPHLRFIRSKTAAAESSVRIRGSKASMRDSGSSVQASRCP
jgi:hypothetical protein